MNRKILKLFLLVITFLLIEGETTKTETEVINLDVTQFDDALETYEHVIVLFQDKYSFQ